LATDAFGAVAGNMLPLSKLLSISLVCKKLNYVAILSENQHIVNEARFPLPSFTNAIFHPKTNLTKKHAPKH